MRRKGQLALHSSIDDKIKALRDEARGGYGKDEVRRSCIKAELRAQQEAKEREAKAEREFIKQECMADWKSRCGQGTGGRSEAQAVPTGSRGDVGSASLPRVDGLGMEEGTGVHDGLAVLQSAWVGEASLFDTAGKSDGVPDMVLAAIQQFQTNTLPLLETVAEEFRDDYLDDVERRRVLERHSTTGLPSLLALRENENENNEGAIMTENGDVAFSDVFARSVTTPGGLYDVFALTPHRETHTLLARSSSAPHTAAGTRFGAPLNVSLRTSSVQRPIPSYPSNLFASSIHRHAVCPSRGAARGSHPPSSAGGGGLPPAGKRSKPPLGHEVVQSGLVVAVHGAEQMMKKLRQQVSSGVRRRAASVEDVGLAGGVGTLDSGRLSSCSRPSTAVTVARVLWPMLLFVCHVCRQCFERDAAEVAHRRDVTAQPQRHFLTTSDVESGSDPTTGTPGLDVEFVVDCPSCGVRVEVREEVQRHYAAQLFAEKGAPRGLLHRCGAEEAERSSDAAAPTPKPKRNACATTCGVGTGEENTYEVEEGVGVGPSSRLATRAESHAQSMSCGPDEEDSAKKGLRLPTTLQQAVQGLYFNHLWDLFEATEGVAKQQ